jgi:hypothetical protein
MIAFLAFQKRNPIPEDATAKTDGPLVSAYFKERTHLRKYFDRPDAPYDVVFEARC